MKKQQLDIKTLNKAAKRFDKVAGILPSIAETAMTENGMLLENFHYEINKLPETKQEFKRALKLIRRSVQIAAILTAINNQKPHHIISGVNKEIYEVQKLIRQAFKYIATGKRGRELDQEWAAAKTPNTSKSASAPALVA
jgi:hypothetical protein